MFVFGYSPLCVCRKFVLMKKDLLKEKVVDSGLELHKKVVSKGGRQKTGQSSTQAAEVNKNINSSVKPEVDKLIKKASVVNSADVKSDKQQSVATVAENTSRPVHVKIEPKTALNKVVDETADVLEVDKFSYENKRSIDVQTLKEMGIKVLIEYAKTLGLDNVSAFHKQEIIYRILSSQVEKNFEIFAEGVLDKLQEGFGFLRSAKFNYIPGPDDIYISPMFIKKFGLRSGDWVRGILRPPREGEKFFALQRIESVNLKPPFESLRRTAFENLTAIFPKEKFILDGEYSTPATRILDLLSPIGKGQRGLIVAPPKTGKTVFLKSLRMQL